MGLIQDLLLEVFRQNTQEHIAQQLRAVGQLSAIRCEDMEPVVNVVSKFCHVIALGEFLQPPDSSKLDCVGTALILDEQLAP